MPFGLPDQSRSLPFIWGISLGKSLQHEGFSRFDFSTAQAEESVILLFDSENSDGFSNSTTSSPVTESWGSILAVDSGVSKCRTLEEPDFQREDTYLVK